MEISQKCCRRFYDLGRDNELHPNKFMRKQGKFEILKTNEYLRIIQNIIPDYIHYILNTSKSVYEFIAIYWELFCWNSEE